MRPTYLSLLQIHEKMGNREVEVVVVEGGTVTT